MAKQEVKWLQSTGQVLGRVPTSSGDGSVTWQDGPLAIATTTNDPTGFPLVPETTISFVDGTRIFSISPTSSSFMFYMKGVKYTKTGTQSIEISDVTGYHFVYFDYSTGNLTETTTFSDDLILKHVYVANIFWDAINDKSIVIGDERHTCLMDGVTHLRLHQGIGTLYVSGLGVTDILVDQSGSLDTHAQLGVQSGIINDEDIQLSISAKSAPANIPIIYYSGASGVVNLDTATNFPVKSFVGGNGRLAYNQWTGSTWQQTEVGQGNFVLCHLVATNDIIRQIYAIQGQSQYTTIANARIGAKNEITSIYTAGLAAKEYIFIGTVIFQTSTVYSNTVKARIVSTDTGGTYVDWRRNTTSSVGSNPVTPIASQINTDTTLFTAGLTSADTNVQLALNTLSSKTVVFYNDSVSLTSAASSTIFTVPSGRRFVIEYFDIVVNSISGASTMPTIELGVSDDLDFILAPVELSEIMNVANARETWDAGALLSTVISSGSVIQMTVTVAGGSTTHSATAILRGFLI
jgi:hypothetical protein